MKEILGIISVAAVLLFAAFFPLLSLDPGDDLELLQAKQETLEIWILSRGFTIGNPHYVPQNVTAKIGALVVWINGDQVHHTATNEEGVKGKLEGQIFDSGPIPPRSEFVLDTSRMLDGVYPYHCTIHPWARGVLTLVREPIGVETDKSLYDIGEKITMRGIASLPTEPTGIPPTLPGKLEEERVAKSVSLEVFDPDHEVFLSREVPVLEGGKYSTSFTAGESGKYEVRASFMGFTASTTFRVAELPREKVTTLGIELEDESGLPVAESKAGELIFIKTPVKNMLQLRQDIAYIVQVKDSDGATVFLEWRNHSIAPMQVFSPAIAWTPEDAGTYTLEVFIWNSMDSPAPLTAKVERATLVVLR